MNEHVVSVMYDSDIADLYPEFVFKEGQNQGQ